MQNLHTLLHYLQTLTLNRLSSHFAKEATPVVELPDFPILEGAEDTPFFIFIKEKQPTQEELLIIIMALVPQVLPNFFDAILARFVPQGSDLPEFGGTKSGNCKGLLPTGETVLFILAGNELEDRLRLQQIIRYSQLFNQEQLLTLETVKTGEPPMSGRLLLDAEFAEWLLMGTVSEPKLSADFPAHRIETALNWTDLVLHPITLKHLLEIKSWNIHGHHLFADTNLNARIRPGYRSLFYGPPGTGKTLAASLIGKDTGRSVYRIDLSMVVSKYIGETEKNLSKIFDKAERRHWILFFDEADALFGKRTDTQDAHDKYANQEVSYLLQRIETFDGLVILASNMKKNLDDAFLRRFESVIYFPMPRPEERLRLWQEALPAQIPLDTPLNLKELATKYELTGGSIINVLRFAALQAIEKNRTLLMSDMIEGIERELSKEGRST